MSNSKITKGNLFKEQIDFFKKKIKLPSERWDDIERSAHDRAFIVAGAMQADLVQDLFNIVQKSIEEGKGLEQFRKDFTSVVNKHGWTNWTGEGSEAGFNWRTKIIYQTNMLTSYAAGRLQQLKHPDLLAVRPYWKYIHDDSVTHPRPLHVSWHGLVLHHDDPFWQTHYPPNGWGCHCRVMAVRASEYDKAKAQGKAQAPHNYQEISNKTGAPLGIDKGFNYQVGGSSLKPMRQFIEDKLIKLDAPIGSILWDSLKAVLLEEQMLAWQAMVARVKETMMASNEARLAYVIESRTVADLASKGVQLENSAVWLRDDELLHAIRDYKAARGAAIPIDIWQNLPRLLSNAVPYLDKEDQALVYVIDLGEEDKGKFVIRVNYTYKTNTEGKRQKIKSNFIRTGGVLGEGNMSDGRYKKLNK